MRKEIRCIDCLYVIHLMDVFACCRCLVSPLCEACWNLHVQYKAKGPNCSL